MSSIRHGVLFALTVWLSPLSAGAQTPAPGSPPAAPPSADPAPPDTSSAFPTETTDPAAPPAPVEPAPAPPVEPAPAPAPAPTYDPPASDDTLLGDDPEPKAGHRAGTLELRIQTASNLSGGSGFSYSTESEIFLVSLIGGVGYFFAPGVAAGADLGFSRTEIGSAEITTIGFAPFFKFASGMAENKAGFFVEASPGVLVFAGDAEGTFVQLAAWLGGHIPVGRSAAFLVGPSIARLEDTEDFGEGEFTIGVRLGLSVYVP